MKKLRIFYNGKVHEVEVEEVYDDKAQMAPTPHPRLEPQVVAKEVKPTFNDKPSGNIESLEAPMPGRIVDVKVKVGQSVNEGDTILVLEAMKLENEVCCESSGVIREIRFKQGDMVDAGDVLAVIG